MQYSAIQRQLLFVRGPLSFRQTTSPEGYHTLAQSSRTQQQPGIHSKVLGEGEDELLAVKWTEWITERTRGNFTLEQKLLMLLSLPAKKGGGGIRVVGEPSRHGQWHSRWEFHRQS
jgi:hypothetical protein